MFIHIDGVLIKYVDVRIVVYIVDIVNIFLQHQRLYHGVYAENESDEQQETK